MQNYTIPIDITSLYKHVMASTKKKPSKDEILEKAKYFYMQDLKYMGYDDKNAATIKPSSATAIEVVEYFYKNEDLGLDKSSFKSFLPFVIYELADPKSGELPQFTKSQRHFANEIKMARKCIIHEQKDPKICMDLVFVTTKLDEFDGNKIMNAALDYLGISNLESGLYNEFQE